jgi:hypothetical protein
MIKDKP